MCFYVNSYVDGGIDIRHRRLCGDWMRLLYIVILFFEFLRRYRLFFGRLEPDGREGDGTGKLGEDVVEGGCGWEAGEDGLWEGYSFSIGLTRREAEIFLLLLEERSNQEIGAALFISVGTVKAHIHNIYRKAGGGGGCFGFWG